MTKLTCTASIASQPTPRTVADWLAYFHANRLNLLSIPWDSQSQLTDAERLAIAHSIRNFQLGESSEGCHLMKLARAYAARVNEPVWVEVVKLFIGEEQRHARDLGRFMQQQDIPLAKQHWSDSLFRRLRHLANLEVALGVLLAAEAIATVYYPALGQATQSPVLQRICQQISQDEVQHVQFQSETLGTIRQAYSAWQLLIVDLLYWGFFRSTVVAVWFDHASVLKTSGYSFWTFSRAACQAMEKAYHIIRLSSC